MLEGHILLLGPSAEGHGPCVGAGRTGVGSPGSALSYFSPEARLHVDGFPGPRCPAKGLESLGSAIMFSAYGSCNQSHSLAWSPSFPLSFYFLYLLGEENLPGTSFSHLTISGSHETAQPG